MLRFDVTCNLTLEAEPGDEVRVHLLPLLNAQQQLLHELIWVGGCEKWTMAPTAGGPRVLDLEGCRREIVLAFTTSVDLTPVWRHPATLLEAPPPINRFPLGYVLPNEHWALDRLEEALRTPILDREAASMVIPHVFAWLRQRARTGDATAYARAPLHWSVCAEDRVLGPLQLAVAAFRTLGVPTRLVAGFAPEPARRGSQDRRAFYLEVHWAGRWWLFDANGQVPNCGAVRIGTGCEPGDLAVIRGPCSARVIAMDVTVDPPPSWGVPLGGSHGLLLSLDAASEAQAPVPVQPFERLQAAQSLKLKQEISTAA